MANENLELEHFEHNVIITQIASEFGRHTNNKSIELRVNVLTNSIKFYVLDEKLVKDHFNTLQEALDLYNCL